LIVIVSFKMKRKAAISAEVLMSENAIPGSSNNVGLGNQKKKRRVRSGFLGDDSCLESAAVKKRKVRESRKRVAKEPVEDGEETAQENVEQKEMLEEMGVNVLSDNSNSCDTVQIQNQSKVLKAKHPNIMESRSPWVSPLKRPDVPPEAAPITNLEIDGGSSSFISDDFFQYTCTLTNKDKRSEKTVKPGKDFFNKLPAELLLSVFKWLPKCSLAKCARVCKRWERLSQDETLWRRLDLGLVTLHPGVVGQVLSRGCAVLRLARATIKSPIFVSHVTSLDTFPSPSVETSRLQYLDLSMSNISPVCLELLLSHCKMIRNLSLEMCSLTDISAAAIAANPNLSVLHLGQVQGLTNLGITRILQKCQQLTELNLGWTELSSEALTSVCDLLGPSVRRLCLAGNRDTFTDEHVENLLDNCPNLRELDVSDSSKLSSACLTWLLEKCLYIESVSTSRCYNIQPSSYLMLAQSPTLLYLNVFGLLREQALNELKERLKGIEINKFMFTSVARPTVGIKRTSIWNLRVRD